MMEIGKNKQNDFVWINYFNFSDEELRRLRAKDLQQQVEIQQLHQRNRKLHAYISSLNK